ncbi:MAG: cation:proton antiporter [Thermotogae bacterium]|nr:cation:proton antiporter [Thermotogota bacterium]
MKALITLVLLPFILGVTALLFKKRVYTVCASLIASLSTLSTALTLLIKGSQERIVITELFGVEVIFDRLSAVFLLTSGIVTSVVVLDSIRSEELNDFRPMIPILIAAMNASFISFDLFNVYVTLELVTITAFILIGLQMLPKQLWGGIKYLLVGNTGMLFYLLGVALYYENFGTFSMSKVLGAPVLPLAMITIGLFVKGGVFLSGLWLPDVHGEAATPISALLSGVVVKTGVYPLLRISYLNPEFGKIVGVFGLLSALLGAIFAISENDTKRLLAYSTVSQIGYTLLNPLTGATYALTHGIFKSWLFLRVGRLESRSFARLRNDGIPIERWIPIFIASLAISGVPALGGYAAKSSIASQISGWEKALFYTAGGLTAVVFAKFIFLPVKRSRPRRKSLLGCADIVYLFSLLAIDLVLKPYELRKISIALLTVLCGWFFYHVFRRSFRPLPTTLESVDHIIGMSTVILMILLLLGRVVPW